MTFHPFDDASSSNAYVAVGASGRCLRLSSSAFALIRARQAGLDYEEISRAMSPATRVPAEELARVGEHLLKTLDRIESEPSPKPWGFVLAATVIPARVVNLTSRRLAWLFGTRAAAVAATLLVVALATRPTLAGGFSTSDAVSAYFIFLLSIVFHEFGHSTACVHAGADPGDIGAAIYIVYPAMYSDVSCAWRLPRYQRLLVDLGGNYFQAIFGLACFWLFLVTDWPPLRGAVLLIMSAITVSLNPLFRFDGYWVLSDLLGVPNLFKESRRAVAQHTNQLYRRSPVSLRWPAGTTVLIVIYGIVSLVLWTWFILAIWPTMLWGRILHYPLALVRVLEPIRHGVLPQGVDLVHLGWATLLLIAAVVIVWRGGVSLCEMVAPWLRRVRRWIVSAAAPSKITQP